MEKFDAPIQKDTAGRLTFIEIPFDARERFCKPKGTIYVRGTINNIQYRSKLLSRGGGKFILVVNTSLQKAIGFDGQERSVPITMSLENIESTCKQDAPVTLNSKIDVLTAIKTRQSIRRFTSASVGEDMITTMLYCGMCAPTAKNKRPYHFVVIRNRAVLSKLAAHNSQAAMLEGAAGAILICGDKNVEGIKEFLYADCAAATQNILLSIHGLGLGGVWCGVASNSDWRKLLIDTLELPIKLEPFALIAYGWPHEEKELGSRWDKERLHFDKW